MQSAPAAPRRRRRPWRGVLGLLVAVLSLELALRLGWGFGNPPLQQADAEIGYVFRANQNLRRFGHRVAINRFHQRSGDAAPLPPAGAVRVLCVGDSVTWGGVATDQAETYPEVLAGLLRAERPHDPVEVLNASAGSWGLGNQAAYLSRFGTLGSRWVVLQIGSHDLLQPTSTGERVGVDPGQPDRRPGSAIGEVVARYLLPRLRGAADAGPPPDPADAERTFLGNMAAFRGMVAQARRAGAGVLVVHTPDRDEVVPGAGGYGTRFDAARGRFLDICRAEGVPVVNLVAGWRGRPETPSYFRDGVHPNPAGNRAIAAAIADALANR